MRNIPLNPKSEQTLSRQIFSALKAGILDGQIAPGEALPSTREMAAALGVSRNTVNLAYDMLWTEGYILSRQGAPSRVAGGLGLPVARRMKVKQPRSVPSAPLRWDFRTGKPDLTAFPWSVWNAMLTDAINGLSEKQFAYGGPKGYEPLCAEIAAWLQRERSMSVKPEDVFITSGSTQALYMLVELLHRDNRVIALEDPSHPGIRTMVADRKYPYYPMPVGAQGAEIELLADQAVSAVYVTPSHQYPLGVIMPAARRAALIRLASEQDFYIIEDDYDSEFRYSGMPISPVYSMSPERVIYVGTFSKTLFPALRIGFVVLPAALQAPWRHSRNYLDVQNPVLEQAALAAFLKTRKMDRHIRRMKRLYGEKRSILLDALHTAFADTVIPQGDVSGLHIALRFPGLIFDPALIRHFTDAGIRVTPATNYSVSAGMYADTLIIGYGHLRPAEIREGVAALAKCLGRLHR